jgi:hypothetical protein
VIKGGFSPDRACAGLPSQNSREAKLLFRGRRGLPNHRVGVQEPAEGSLRRYCKIDLTKIHGAGKPQLRLFSFGACGHLQYSTDAIHPPLSYENCIVYQVGRRVVDVHTVASAPTQRRPRRSCAEDRLGAPKISREGAAAHMAHFCD